MADSAPVLGNNVDLQKVDMPRTGPGTGKLPAAAELWVSVAVMTPKPQQDSVGPAYPFAGLSA
jgi:hypothetical protein